MIELLAKLFADAAEGMLDDNQLAERANSCLPSNLCELKENQTEAS